MLLKENDIFMTNVRCVTKLKQLATILIDRFLFTYSRIFRFSLIVKLQINRALSSIAVASRKIFGHYWSIFWIGFF